MRLETVTRNYVKARERHCGSTNQEKMRYDFGRLLDATWSLKAFMEAVSSENHKVGSLFHHDIFDFIVVCTVQIEEAIKCQENSIAFIDCWFLFAEIIKKLPVSPTNMNNKVSERLVRLLFVSALIFDMPATSRLENIIANPLTRRIQGTFPASTEDIEFGSTLPGQLVGPFESINEILLNHGENLLFYRGQI